MQQSYSKAGVVLHGVLSINVKCHLQEISIIILGINTIKTQEKKFKTVREPNIFVNYFQ